MPIFIKVLCLCLLVNFSVGCSHQTVVSGSFTVDKDDYDASVRQLSERASFDLSCSKEKLSFIVLETFGGTMTFVKQMGISGCGKKAVYIHHKETGWVLNSTQS